MTRTLVRAAVTAVLLIPAVARAQSKLPYLPVVYFPGTAVLLAWFARTFLRSSGYAREHWAKETDSA